MIRNRLKMYEFLSRVQGKARLTMNLMERIEIAQKGFGDAMGIKKSAIYLWSPENTCFVKGIGSKLLPLESQRIISQNNISVASKEKIYYKLRKGQSVIIDGKEASSYLPDAKSIRVFPLVCKSGFLGIYVMDWKISIWDKTIGIKKSEILDLINMFSKQLSISIENALLYKTIFRENKRYKEELKIAYNIQHFLLSRNIPKLKNIKMSAKSIPSKVVGGDFYYFKRFRADKHAVGIAIGDVLSSIEQCAKYFDEPKITFANINSIITSHLDKYSPHYVSAFYGVLDTESFNFTYCKAGHLPPLWYRKAEKDVHTLDARGTVLGLFKRRKFEQKTVQLKSGDKIIFYTDGITEARNKKEEQFGIKRLKEIIISRKDAKPLQLNTSIFRAVRKFIGRKIQKDDMTLITVEILPPPR